MPPNFNQAWQSADRFGLLLGKRVRQKIHALRSPLPHPRCLLVAGVQRSGTNMVMDVLERSHATDVYHERDPRAFVNFQLREEAHIQSLIAASPADVVVVKCLMECQKLAQLLAAFAPARALWVFRDYRDVVNSMLRSFRNQAKQVQRLARDRDSDGWLGECMSDATHALVRDLATPGLDDANAAAIQWYLRNIRFFEQSLRDDPHVITVHYDELVTHSRAQFRRLFEFAGIEFSPRVLRWVNDSSVRKSSPPPLRPDVDQLCANLYLKLQATVAETTHD